ncbi:hypothetical protein BC835DRAFT_1412213 [Cytidiella melzeri]|nr:hypothetical protein BC835DRAFT_1412213 [Cytidiella melzeri]
MLVDWEDGIYLALQPMLERVKPSMSSRKETLLAFTGVEKDLQAKISPHPDGSQSVAVIETSMHPGGSIFSSITTAGDWKPFPDTITALAALSKYYKLAILSNVDNESFSKTCAVLHRSDTDNQFQFDGVYTAQDIEKHQVLVTADSLLHDHVPANQLNLSSVWIAREGAVKRQEPVATFDLKFTTLGALFY